MIVDETLIPNNCLTHSITRI